jgi:hypothetical protein
LTEGPISNAPAVRPLPEALREALRHDTAAVRPLLPPAGRTLLALGVAVTAAALLIGFAGLRPDRDSLNPMLLWTPAVVRILAGLILMLLAMREGVPGSGAPGVVRYSALLGAPLLLTLLTEWVDFGARGPMSSASLWVQFKSALGCYPREILLTLPALLFIAWLLARAYPLRPVFTAAAGGTGAALIADAVLHLTCPMTNMVHTLVVHGGAVATVAAVCAGIGWLVGRRPLR